MVFPHDIDQSYDKQELHAGSFILHQIASALLEYACAFYQEPKMNQVVSDASYSVYLYYRGYK